MQTAWGFFCEQIRLVFESEPVTVRQHKSVPVSFFCLANRRTSRVRNVRLCVFLGVQGNEIPPDRCNRDRSSTRFTLLVSEFLHPGARGSHA